MELNEIVMKLIGDINAVGETHEDAQRLANLKELTNLIDKLLYEVSWAARDELREEASVRAIGKHAAKFLQELKEA